MITLLTIHCVKSFKILLELEIQENRCSTLDFRLILIMLSLSEHDQYSELEMTLQDHKGCLSATYNSTLFRHGHLSSLLRTGKGSDCLLHSAERSQSSCVNPQRAEGWTAVCVCVCGERVRQFLELLKWICLSHYLTCSERQQRDLWSTDFLFSQLVVVIPVTYTHCLLLFLLIKDF